MPSDAMICLISFGAMCMLHEIADPSEYNKVHVFHGSRELSSASVGRMLLLLLLLAAPASVAAAPLGTLVLQVELKFLAGTQLKLLISSVQTRRPRCADLQVTCS